MPPDGSEERMTRTIDPLFWPVAWQFRAPTQPDPNDELGEGRPDEPGDRARWVLLLGIFGLLIGPLGIFAWLAGNACLKAIAEGRMDPTCESNARAGRLLGLIAIGMFTFKVTVILPLACYFWFV